MNKSAQFVTGALAVVAVLFTLDFLGRRVVKDVGEAVENFNEGTPFEDTGVIGAIGNVTDQASGNILSRFGSFLGQRAADLREKILGLDKL